MTLPISSRPFVADANSQKTDTIEVNKDSCKGQFQCLDLIVKISAMNYTPNVKGFLRIFKEKKLQAEERQERINEFLKGTKEFNFVLEQTYTAQMNYINSQGRPWVGDYNLFYVNTKVYDRQVRYGAKKPDGKLSVKFDEGELSVEAKLGDENLGIIEIDPNPSRVDKSFLNGNELALDPMWQQAHNYYELSNGEHPKPGFFTKIFRGNYAGDTIIALPNKLTISFNQDTRDWLDKLSSSERLVVTVAAFVILGPIIQNVFSLPQKLLNSVEKMTNNKLGIIDRQRRWANIQRNEALDELEEIISEIDEAEKTIFKEELSQQANNLRALTAMEDVDINDIKTIARKIRNAQQRLEQLEDIKTQNLEKMITKEPVDYTNSNLEEENIKKILNEIDQDIQNINNELARNNETVARETRTRIRQYQRAQQERQQEEANRERELREAEERSEEIEEMEMDWDFVNGMP